MSDRDYREAKFQRAVCGAQAREAMRKADESHENWWAICRKCGKRTEGSLAKIRQHREKCDG